MMKRNTDDFMSLFRCLKPTIAMVHGAGAVAGGSDIALCCDFLSRLLLAILFTIIYYLYLILSIIFILSINSKHFVSHVRDGSNWLPACPRMGMPHNCAMGAAGGTFHGQENAHDR